MTLEWVREGGQGEGGGEGGWRPFTNTGREKSYAATCKGEGVDEEM